MTISSFASLLKQDPLFLSAPNSVDHESIVRYFDLRIGPSRPVAVTPGVVPAASVPVKLRSYFSTFCNLQGVF